MPQPTTCQTIPAINNESQGEPRVSLLAAGLYVAAAAYDEALRRPTPVATLDQMVQTVAEILPDVLKVVAAKGLDTKSSEEFGEALRVATVAPLLGFTAIEHARAEIDPDYHYLLDYLVENLRAGGDPRVIRQAAEEAPQRLRDQRAAALADEQAHS